MNVLKSIAIVKLFSADWDGVFLVDGLNPGGRQTAYYPQSPGYCGCVIAASPIPWPITLYGLQVELLAGASPTALRIKEGATLTLVGMVDRTRYVALLPAYVQGKLKRPAFIGAMPLDYGFGVRVAYGINTNVLVLRAIYSLRENDDG